MERKHATVIALTFVLVGLMFFSVDTPLILQKEATPVVHEAPEIIEQIADEPVSQGSFQMNVVSNPSFEDWDTLYHEPEDWDGSTTGYSYGDPAYTGSIKHGNYAGFVETQSGDFSPAGAYLRTEPDTTPYSYLRYGVSLSLDWYLIDSPSLLDGASLQVMISLQNATGNPRTMHYYLSHRNVGFVNTTYEASFSLNDTVGSWHSFDRNITTDYIAAFGSSDLSSTHYIIDVYFQSSTPNEATGLLQAVVDDVSMYNSSYSGWILNGDFETGTGSNWLTYLTSLTTIFQSPDSTDGSYSLNISKTASDSGVGYGRISRNYQLWQRFCALEPGSNILSWDWKYSDTDGAGVGQYAYLRISFGNSSTYRLHIMMGRGNDILPGNSSTSVYIEAPGFGARDSWQHSEIDLYEVTRKIGFFNLTISEMRFEAYQAVTFPDATLELLVDNFKMVTYPMSNPTFEHTDPVGIYNPFLGWWRYSSAGEVTQSSVAHDGLYSANITVENGVDGVYRHDINFKFDSALFIDFWWRLEDIQDGVSSYAQIDFEFLVGGGNRHISYVLGMSSTYAPSNGTTWKYILVDEINQTSTWTHLFRNITADIENLYLTSADDWITYQITAIASASAGNRTSLLVDDFHFKDMAPPSIDAVAFLPTQYYYNNGYLQVSASDARPGVSEVMINYTTNGGTSWNTISTTYNSDWYEVNIPAQDYGTTVEFSVIAIDGCGLVTIDDNGGVYYSYYVDDNADPLLTITNPANNTDQSGLLAITADAFDAGAGVEYVSFNADGGGAITDYTAPYSQNWNLDDEALGSHFVVVTVHDNAGNEVTKTHYFTVVDTVAPALDSPDDVEFTVGETGYIIDWDPTDVRPYGYVVYVDDVIIYFGNWNSSSEHIVIELDGLAVGTYNYTCVVVDGTINGAIDTVIVTVNEVVTTPTSTTDTTTTDTSTTTTSGPTGGGNLTIPLLIVGVVGVIGILLIVFVVLPKMKKT